MFNTISKATLLIIFCFVASYKAQSQSFLKKTLNVIEKANKTIESVTNNPSKEEKQLNNSKQTNTDVFSVQEKTSTLQKDQGLYENGIYVGNAFTDREIPITPHMTENTKIINMDERTITCTKHFKDGVCFALNPNHGWGVFDTAGIQIIDYKLSFGTLSGNSQMPEFENGYCPVRDPKNSYIINKRGEVIKQFTNIKYLSNFRNGIATALQTIPNPKNKYMNITRTVYINTKGELIFPHLYFTVQWNTLEPMRPFNDGLAAYFDYDQKLWGFINTKGEAIIKAQYKKVQDFHDGYAAVLTSNNKWGFIDNTNTFRIDPIYSLQPMPFSEGFALVKRKEGANCLIDKTGKTVLDLIDEITPFYQERAFVKFNYQSPYRKYDSNNQYQFIIDKSFKLVGFVKDIPIFTDNNHQQHWPTHNLWYADRILMDTKGNAIYAAKEVQLFSEGRAFCYIDDNRSALTSCFINTKGEIIFLFRQNEF